MKKVGDKKPVEKEEAKAEEIAHPEAGSFNIEDLIKSAMESQAAKEEPEKEDKKENGFNFAELLNGPLAASFMGGCKDMLKKEKQDPNICEISIKAPSEVVLKLFKVSK